MDVNGSMLISFSELMAIGPYILRSHRIKKMFDFREIYWETEKMPKERISKWREARVMFYFILGLFIIGISYMCLDLVFNVFPNYNSMGTIIEAWYPQQLHIVTQDIDMKTQFSLDNFMICTLSFVEYILLLWALYT